MKINKNLNIDLNILSPQKHIRIHEGDVDSVDILIGVSVDDESVDLDGVTIKYDATINNYLAEQDADGSVVDGKISIPVTQNMAAMSGLLLIDVRMIQSDQILLTQTICATVEKAVVNGSTYIDFDKVTIVQRMNALEEKMDYIEELVENFDTSKLIVSANRPPSGAPAEVDVDLLRVGDTWILSGDNIVYKLVEAQYNYQPVPSVEPYHKFTWQSLNARLFNDNIAPPTEEQSVTVEYTIGDTTFTWTAIQFFSFGDMYRQTEENYLKYFECVYSGYGRYTWRETDSYTIEEINTKLGEKENTANKTSAITAANKASSTLFPTVGATIQFIENNYKRIFEAAVNPPSNQDTSSPYVVGDMWVNTADQTSWVLERIATYPVLQWKRLTSRVILSKYPPPSYVDNYPLIPLYCAGDIWIHRSYYSSGTKPFYALNGLYICVGETSQSEPPYDRHNIRWYRIITAQSTLAGYGITDAYTKAEIDAMIGDIETLLSQV